MSRNFELMQELEREKAFRSSVLIEPAFPPSAEDRKLDDRCRTTSDLTLGLVQRVFLQRTQEVPRTVVFAGIDHGNGCSQIAASVAGALAANAPKRVCLVEANFRSPGLASILGTTNYHGFTDALLKRDPIRSFVKPVCNEDLWLLSSGPITVDSPGLFTSERLQARFAELRSEFDFVILDAPPMTRYSDAIALGQLSDGVVLVLEAGSTRREAALTAVWSLRSSGIEILGAVLNKRTFPIPEKIYNRI